MISSVQTSSEEAITRKWLSSFDEEDAIPDANHYADTCPGWELPDQTITTWLTKVLEEGSGKRGPGKAFCGGKKMNGRVKEKLCWVRCRDHPARHPLIANGV